MGNHEILLENNININNIIEFINSYLELFNIQYYKLDDDTMSKYNNNTLINNNINSIEA